MYFTREPIIESIVTPKEGYKIVVRNSKGLGQEEYFVDAVEIVSFGSVFFFRSLERPKSFMVPVTDYELLEVREAKMVLKAAGLNRAVKIGGGRDAARKSAKEPVSSEVKDEKGSSRVKRERKRSYRRKKEIMEEKAKPGPIGEETAKTEETLQEKPSRTPRPIMPPPSTLISDTIERYKGNELFSEVFQDKPVDSNDLRDESVEEEEKDGS